MSIFPKRTIPGKIVTIHLNLNTSYLADEHIFPFIQIGVKDPSGCVTMLLEDHILALPDPAHAKCISKKSKPKHGGRSIPLLILKDRLDRGKDQTDLEKILKDIESGRHFYLNFKVPADARLGKYQLKIDIYTDGEIRHSNTADHDFFWVEHLTLAKVARKNNRYIATIDNPSEEPVPVKIIECFIGDNGLQTQSREFALPAHQNTDVILKAKKSYLLYNEDREMLPLLKPLSPFVLRNQRMLCLSGDKSAQNSILVVARDGVRGFELTGNKKLIWELASGLITKEEIIQMADNQSYKEMLGNQLISEQWL